MRAGDPAGFATDQVAGKTFAYAKASGTTGATGALTFNADRTWSVALATFSGTWTIDANGNLVCITTIGGTDMTTYTRLNATTNPMSTSSSVVRTDPSKPGGISAATLTVVPTGS